MRCPICNHLGEDGGHLSFKCKLAKHLWRLLGLEPETEALASIQTTIGATEVIMQAREHKKLMMTIALWFTWSERNMIREEGRRRSPQVLARLVELYVKENTMPSCEPVVRMGHQLSHWIKPAKNTLKLNCDASFFPNELIGSWGALIKDSDGDLVLLGRDRINHLLSPFHPELIACL
jgi:hypothetical protein